MKDQNIVPWDLPSSADQIYIMISWKKENVESEKIPTRFFTETQMKENSFFTLHWGPSNEIFNTDAATLAVWIVLENGE